MIPRKLHFIWVGDEAMRPDNCIATWARRHPDYEIKVWGNATLSEYGWLNNEHMMAMWDRELCGVADMMRWEILFREGGIVLDADSICLQKLDDDFLDCEAFACWENEIVRPGLIATGYVGSQAGNAFVRRMIHDIHEDPSVPLGRAWQTVGPLRLTLTHRREQYGDLRILPSHYFIPEHYSGLAYSGDGPVYAHQLWGSTKAAYDDLHRLQFDDDGRMMRVERAEMVRETAFAESDHIASFEPRTPA